MLELYCCTATVLELYCCRATVLELYCCRAIAVADVVIVVAIVIVLPSFYCYYFPYFL